MDFKTLVIGKYSDLPNHQKHVADFFLDRPHDFAMLSILDLAKKVGVSEATIFRFAQSLGWSPRVVRPSNPV